MDPTRRMHLTRPIPRTLLALRKAMSGTILNLSPIDETEIVVQVNHALISVEALLKTCYWFSKDFVCDVTYQNAERSVVTLKAKPGADMAASEAKEHFLAQALDFAVRERVTARTSGVRDLLLAKAFSESGVLEDQPEGVFGDVVEETKPNGMFKILSNQ